MKKHNIHLAWILTILGIVSIIGILVIMITFHPWEFTVRFEMDENTKQAMQSINYTAINEQKTECYVIDKIVSRKYDIVNNVYLGGDSYYDYNSTRKVNCLELRK